MPKLLTEEQEGYLLSIQYQRNNQECAKIMNEKFPELSLTESQVKGWRGKHHIISGIDSKFSKGHVPCNKGKKMPADVYEKVKATMFKKGNRPKTWRPVGSERTDARDGYVLIKVQEPNVWMSKARYVWEQYHSKLQKNECVVVLDGDKSNLNLDNLAVISRGINSFLNKEKLRYSNKELTASGIALAKVTRIITKRKKQK